MCEPICPGHNDGIRDSTPFCDAYIDFIKSIKNKYPGAKIILLTCPMVNTTLTTFLKNYISSINNFFNEPGYKNIYRYFFKKQFHHRCFDHPDLKEQQEISNEFVGFIKENNLADSNKKIL